MPGLRLIQFSTESGQPGVGWITPDGVAVGRVGTFASTHALALSAIAANESLDAHAARFASAGELPYSALLEERRVLAPLTHPDTARCFVSAPDSRISAAPPRATACTRSWPRPRRCRIRCACSSGVLKAESPTRVRPVRRARSRNGSTRATARSWSAAGPRCLARVRTRRRRGARARRPVRHRRRPACRTGSASRSATSSPIT